MSYLPTDLRTLLEKSVIEARDVAELGAKAALEALGVGDGKLPLHLKSEERDLRVRLRARARQLGDTLDAKTQVQAVDHLVREVAYEHWHRMLFARFLAESHLLVEPETGVAVSLDECRELARERSEDPWALAGRFAERMLPAIFRSNDPALALALPPERLNRLEALLEALPAEIFAADDALGWVYQFWQSKRKKEVNSSGRKIDADELPAVTQLFTEPYMVRFLLHNTLGAWHAGKVLAARPELATSAKSEAELRRACALPGYDWTYLRFVRDPADTDSWRPAAGNCPGWPGRALEVTLMDPCCGSGHFLVEAFSALVALRQSEEGLDLPGAVRAVLALNLHGLEIDPRCTQLAAFAVAFAAWRKLGRVSPLPPIQIGCSGLATGVPKTEWLRLVGDDSTLRRGMERLHDLFHKAPTLGSLLDPRGEVGQDLFTASLERLEEHLIEAVGQEEVARDAASAEVAVTATGMTSTVRALIRQYTLVATNVPFLGRESHEVALSTHLESHFPAASADLSAAMLLRASMLLLPGGSLGLVLPQNWWAGTAYEDFRSWALSHLSWNVLAALGEEAWLTFADRGPNTCLFISSKSNPVPGSLVGIDVSSKPREKTIRRDEKDALLQGKELAVATRPHSIPQLASQSDYWRRPGKKIFLGKLEDHPTLATIARSGEGSSTGDSDRFSRCYWEVKKTPDWTEYCGPGNLGDLHCECREYIFWEQGKGELAQSDAARIQNTELWKEDGVLVGRVRGVTATPFFGGSFKKGAVLLVPRSKSDLALLLAFASSAEYEQSLRNLDPRVSAATSTVTEVPVDLGAWRERAAQAFGNGVPLPTCADPSQWLFHGHPARAGAPLQVAVARLLGYRWPAELDPGMRLSTEAREWVKRSEGLVGLEDQDGIVCLSSLRNEEPATVRLRSLLAAAFGKEWSAAKERELLAATPEQAPSLEEWLRDRFFEEHCALFHQRPFVWHVCDGRKDGFHALVNYHRLAEGNGKGRQLLESLAFAYVGEWIDRQRRGAAGGETGAEARLAAAVELQGELKKILDGEDPYDIFVRWKPLHRQPIGWEPDIDDGVRLNARPFLKATLSAGRAGAGLFRAKPSIHWRKDRGAEPQRDRADFPWFYGSDGKFHGERHNDLHLSLDEKRRAREAKSKGGVKR